VGRREMPNLTSNLASYLMRTNIETTDVKAGLSDLLYDHAVKCHLQMFASRSMTILHICPTCIGTHAEKKVSLYREFEGSRSWKKRYGIHFQPVRALSHPPLHRSPASHSTPCACRNVCAAHELASNDRFHPGPMRNSSFSHGKYVTPHQQHSPAALRSTRALEL
jgi:hypothetical protein